MIDHSDHRRHWAMKTCDHAALERGGDFRPDQPTEKGPLYFWLSVAALGLLAVCFICARVGMVS